MKKSIINAILLSIPVLFLLFLGLRGSLGSPTKTNINTPSWMENGPFELSPERGRFGLLFSIVEDHGLFFSVPVARFTLPDLGYKNGHYVSLFAPAVSYLAIPGYLIGKYFGASQVGSFAVIALFAFINFWLIRGIAILLGSNRFAATLAGLVFAFATPAFPYGVTLYQHHISTFLILLSSYLLIRWNNFWSLFTIWFLCACSIPVDYPNLFLMAPIGLFALGRVASIVYTNSKLNFSLKPLYVITFIGIVFPLIFFFWFNKASYNNPLQFSGTVSTIKAIDANGNPASDKTVNVQDIEKYTNPDSQKRSVFNFFRTRSLLNGLYIHLFSPDRGVLYFTPVLFLGLFGFAFSTIKKDKKQYFGVLISVIFADLLLYSMWGDPWGGWAFGSRYLIPAYAIVSIILALLLSRFRKNIAILAIFIILFVYSSGVNVLGAITSNANPPQVQILSLEQQTGMVQKYTFMRNWDAIKQGNSKSFVYQTFLSPQVTASQYYFFVTGLVVLLGFIQIISLYLSRD